MTPIKCSMCGEAHGAVAACYSYRPGGARLDWPGVPVDITGGAGLGMPVPTGAVPRRTASTPEPAPVANAQPAVWPLVMVDMAERDKFGREKYGTPLQPHNGRDALKDAYQEALDLAVYLRTAIFERDGK